MEKTPEVQPMILATAYIVVSLALGWLAGCGRSELLRRYRK